MADHYELALLAGKVGIKFGGLPFICQFFFRVHVCIAILYHTVKFKSTNSVKNVSWGKTAKFNDRLYFRLYGIQP